MSKKTPGWISDQLPPPDEKPSAGPAADPARQAAMEPESSPRPPIRKHEKSVRYGTIASVMILPAIVFLIQSLYMTDDPRIPEWIQAITLGNLMAFGSLLALWIVLGGRPLPWRLVVVVGLMTPCLAYLFRGGVLSRREDFVSAELILGGSVMLIEGFLFTLLRWIGLELVHDAERPVDWHRGRYSLGYLFHWMAAVAVLSAILTWVPWRKICDSMDILVVGVVGAVPSLLLTLAVLGRKQRWLLRTAAALVGLVIIVSIYFAFNPPVSDGRMVLIFGLLFTMLVFWHLMVLYPLRLAGYRLVWRARRVF